ncbi:hypothetical protein SSAG_02242 [Streptomyces sp. Mg1]|nr:hypothetical protein SSAG_02242 [Streptomyces sp. Mg1]
MLKGRQVDLGGYRAVLRRCGHEAELFLRRDVTSVRRDESRPRSGTCCSRGTTLLGLRTGPGAPSLGREAGSTRPTGLRTDFLPAAPG